MIASLDVFVAYCCTWLYDNRDRRDMSHILTLMTIFWLFSDHIDANCRSLYLFPPRPRPPSSMSLWGFCLWAWRRSPPPCSSSTMTWSQIWRWLTLLPIYLFLWLSRQLSAIFSSFISRYWFIYLSQPTSSCPLSLHSRCSHFIIISRADHGMLN